MTRVVYTRRALSQLDAQLAYGLENFGRNTASRTIGRLRRFIDETLTHYPRSGTWDDSHGLYEAWVSRTPFVVLYRWDAPSDTLTVLAIFHHAEDRRAWDASEEQE